ncbi:MAG: hypothetical protein Q8P67_13045, partial [archaeon]|nr:hypothetical protein [archaeon]
ISLLALCSCALFCAQLYAHFNAPALLPSEAAFSTLAATAAIASVAAAIAARGGTLLDGSLVLLYNALTVAELSASAPPSWLRFAAHALLWALACGTLLAAVSRDSSSAAAVRAHLFLAAMLAAEAFLLRSYGQPGSLSVHWFLVQSLVSSLAYVMAVKRFQLDQ